MLSVFGVLAVSGTVIDVIVRRKNSFEFNKLWLAFSVYSNGRKLFNVNRENSPGAIGCLEGLRSISMLFIILRHRYRMNLHGIANMEVFMEFYKSYNVFFMWEYLCIDTFLTVGGFLCSVSLLKAMERKSFNMFKLVVHRYVRYTPVLLAVAIIFQSLFRHIKAPDPYAAREEIVRGCKDYWWSMLLHIQNYVNPKKMCLPHSWYMSVDFQLFLISPLLIYPALKYGWKYLWSLPALATALAVYTIKFCIKNKFKFSRIGSPQFFGKVYVHTDLRMAPWLLGMVLGYIVFKIQDKKIRMNRQIVTLIWILSIGSIALIIACFYPFAQREDVNTSTVVENAFFLGIQRLLWPLPICWIIFACHNLKSGGVIRWILSLPRVATCWKTLTVDVHHTLFVSISEASKCQSSERFYTFGIGEKGFWKFVIYDKLFINRFFI